ncbi:unnamed protein product [Moneuplotes crassus]|uniref:Uncharacterized protein n=1 Tax=Euplotes crassus TaxID=5936 RepID=A0AAD1XTG8_EUPCR|nr:unnamed protein product [Moneuplotes crassus]
MKFCRRSQSLLFCGSSSWAVIDLFNSFDFGHSDGLNIIPSSSDKCSLYTFKSFFLLSSCNCVILACFSKISLSFCARSNFCLILFQVPAIKSSSVSELSKALSFFTIAFLNLKTSKWFRLACSRCKKLVHITPCISSSSYNSSCSVLSNSFGYIEQYVYRPLRFALFLLVKTFQRNLLLSKEYKLDKEEDHPNFVLILCLNEQNYTALYSFNLCY